MSAPVTDTPGAAAPAVSAAARLNVATVTQYLSSQTSLADALTGNDKRRAVLLRSVPEWHGPPRPTWGEGCTARVAVALSPLAVHELVLNHLAESSDGGDGPAVLVVLTDREQGELDASIVARTHKKRVNTVDGWDVVREAFGAEQLETRLKDASWAAEALLDATPPGGWPPHPGSVLSRRTALSTLALRRLRLGRYDSEAGRAHRAPVSDTLDIHTLLGWSLDPGGPERLLELRAPERKGLTEFLGEEGQAGPAGQALLALVEAEHGPDAVAFGLVCGALWLHAPADADTYRARGRAERWFGEQPPAVGEALDVLAAAFGRACEEYVSVLLTTASREQESAALEARAARRTADTVLDRATALSRQFGAEHAARASPLLLPGLEARFAAVGHALALPDSGPEPVRAALEVLDDHKRAAEPQARVRVQRAHMAQRLAQWLAGGPDTACRSAADGIERHILETGWVDQALEHIEAGGDPDPVLKSAYDKLALRVREARHEIDRDFARALATWTAAGTPPGSMLTVESFLDRVVKPIVQGGEGRRVLLVVLDGMSAAIATELGEEIRSSWAEFDPVADGSPHRRAMAAALPTVTAVSRTSLFAGRLVKGAQADEKRLFPQQKLWGGAPAAVFHKDDLRAETAGEVFGPQLTEALGDGRTHVAVVLNAIDDRLGKEQKLGDGAWQVQHIPGLAELLRVAAVEGMAVVLTSDHGHVVDRHGAKVEAGAPESARHRVAGEAEEPAAAAEVALSGPRVVWPEPGSSVVALWDADSRFTGLKAGYHGGASLAEVAIPVLAFLPFGAAPPRGWRELGEQQPPWWKTDEKDARLLGDPPSGAATKDAGPGEKQPSRHKPSRAQAELAATHDSLFDVAPAPVPEPVEPAERPEQPEPVAPEEAIVAELFASETFRDQLELLARKPRERELEKFRHAVLALLEAGGTLPVTALAQRVGFPATRADGFAAVLRQLLNYDGVQVLETMPDGRTLRLHADALRAQFGLA
ncbi:BREX-2 system phosphatase PglZ [Streptomyces spirodelae]|uniref:BREX-2 system phosphatase PglZ n=1 Tax=Streptomyces spirodelae TaxID=2812904 RepID=A0ABS3X3T8_9ACTN|nr:BREX-2 system phosphatase PglZ [Streptomyces spirodelae]MBO8189772.1 BREX-2 system phosphatase PglZ [Streptomyces spirodelae]